MESSAVDKSVGDTSRHLRELVRERSVTTIRGHGGIRLRKEFVCLREVTAVGSDRRVPPPEERPPSTRLMGRRGVALRLALTALFEAHARTEPGDRPVSNMRPLSHAQTGQVAWTDLLATSPDDALDGRTAMTAEDKKRRQLTNGLDALVRGGLVRLPHADDPRNKHREFELLPETGQATGTTSYAVPHPSDTETLLLPTNLFTNGWISVLTDGELAFLLMTMIMHRPDQGDGFMLPAQTRLRAFGIGPETYEAHRTLEAFGLIRVTRQPSRSSNGRVKSIGTSGTVAVPDVVQNLPDGLNRDGYSTVADALDSMFCR